jgi:hypothetical protein
MGHWALATRSKYSSRNVRHKQPIRHPLLEVLAMRTFGAAVTGDVAGGVVAANFNRFTERT